MSDRMKRVEQQRRERAEKRAAATKEQPGVFQVVMPDVMSEGFEDWLFARGLHLFPIPVEDDLPTFGIGLNDKPDGT